MEVVWSLIPGCGVREDGVFFFFRTYSSQLSSYENVELENTIEEKKKRLFGQYI